MVQCEPLSVERNTPPSTVPANRHALSTASAKTPLFESPASTASQPAPLFVLRKTPSNFVPAKRVVPERTSEVTTAFDKPAEFQCVPLFVERNTPPYVPAKICASKIANDVT